MQTLCNKQKEIVNMYYFHTAIKSDVLHMLTLIILIILLPWLFYVGCPTLFVLH